MWPNVSEVRYFPLLLIRPKDHVDFSTAGWFDEECEFAWLILLDICLFCSLPFDENLIGSVLRFTDGFWIMAGSSFASEEAGISDKGNLTGGLGLKT